MGIDYWYACLDCKRYIDLWRQPPIYPNDNEKDMVTLDWKKIEKFKEWIEIWDNEFGRGVDLEFVQDILGWFIKHWGHHIVIASDAAENEPWRRYVEGWYMNIKPGWQEETRAEPPNARYKNWVRQWV